MKKVCVLLDPGHVRQTPGKRSPDGRLLEYQYTREILFRIQEELMKLGIDSWNTHPEDDFVNSKYDNDSRDLVLRVSRINAKYKSLKAEGKSAILLSIHVNAAGNGGWYNATGWSAYTTKGVTNSDKLSECLYEAAEEVLVLQDKKIRKDFSDGDCDYESDFYVIKKSNCPAILTENFFMDSKKDIEYLLSEQGKSDIVNIHVKGVLKYIKNFFKHS